MPAGAGQSAPCLSADQTSQSVEGARGGTHMPGSESRFLRENPMGLAWIGQLSLGQSAVAVGQAGQLVVLRCGATHELLVSARGLPFCPLKAV